MTGLDRRRYTDSEIKSVGNIVKRSRNIAIN
jgi:hypothetical protein